MKYAFIFFIFGLLVLQSCEEDPIPTDLGIDLSDIEYNPEEYTIKQVVKFPVMEIPADNPMTKAGVDLGRHLFYDPILSADSTQSCASCHLTTGSFTDNLAVSKGIDGIEGSRSSMSLLNVGYYLNGLFWDGRIETLEEQALLPVEDPIELHNNWDNVEAKLKKQELYRTKFRQAFGIDNSNEITRDLSVKALAQFERSLVSSGRAKWDRVQDGKAEFTQEERLGRNIFFESPDDPMDIKDGGCFHCHIDPLFTDNNYLNNGIEDLESIDDFQDKGLGSLTGNRFDNGKFRTPTLRNIEFTAPYMHDGRFETLQEVLDAYNEGGHGLENEDQNLPKRFALEQKDQDALLAFLKTLSDTTFMNDARYKSPF